MIEDKIFTITVELLLGIILALMAGVTYDSFLATGGLSQLMVAVICVLGLIAVIFIVTKIIKD